MAKYSISPDGLIETVQESLSDLGWPVLVAVLIFTCITTRIITGLQSGKADTEETRSVRLVPYWFPWVGHGFSIAWNHVSLLGKTRDRMDEPVVNMYIGGTKHNVVTSPTMAQTVMSSKATSSASAVNYALKTIFGDRGPIRSLSPEAHKTFHNDIPDLFMQDPFVTEASTTAARMIERQTPNLVTFCKSVVDQAVWERDSELEVINENDKSACEVNFFSLIRNFVGHVTTSTLMGQALMEVFPDLLVDLWKFDDRYPVFAMGVPRWLPFPGLPAAYAARDRLIATLAAFHKSFNYWDDGVDPGIDFRDMDDVSEPIKQRIRKSKSLGLSPMGSAPGHLSLLWAMNGNSPNIIFWHLLRLYTDPAFLAEIRKEIASHVKASRRSREETGFPLQESPTISIDFDGLLQSCHLLRASFYETLRLDSASISFRQLTSDLTVTESPKEARTAGLAKPRSYQIKKGESVAIPHGVIHNDPRYFSNPEQFDPLRFIQTDPETGAKKASMHTIHPLGFGAPNGKEQAFFEREILAFTAAIISLWDIEPVEGESLALPGHRQSGGAFLPKKDIRVRIAARV